MPWPTMCFQNTGHCWRVSQVRVTFGIHSYLASRRTFPDMLSELRRIVTLPECIAVGEIDMATACDCRQPYSRSACRMALLYSQMDLLYELLVVSMETKKAVVLRCWEWLNLCCRRSRCLMEGHLYH